MSFPYMPLWVGDYVSNTGHLSAEEHGAYLLLILHYWTTGGLPNDDVRLARIAKLTPEGWSASRETLAAFFEEGWRHNRVEDELKEAERISAAGRAGGLASGKARKRTVVERSLNDPANDLATIGQPSHSPSQSQVRKLSSGIAKAKSWTPPRHGATSDRVGRVYVLSGSPEWQAYAEDFKKARGVEPEANQHGGKWFRILGESPANG